MFFVYQNNTSFLRLPFLQKKAMKRKKGYVGAALREYKKCCLKSNK